MSTTSPHAATIVVVDPNPSDYQGMLDLASTMEVNVCFFPTGADALRFARRWPVGLWVINTRLNDTSGFDLAGKLRRGKPDVRVFIVGDTYQIDDELETLTLGLAKYLCKPVEPSWILQWAMWPARIASTTRSAVMAERAPAFAPAGEVAEIGCDMPAILPFPRQPQRRPAA